MRFYLQGGTGYYMGKMTLDYLSQPGTGGSTSVDQSVTGSVLGFHAGAGVELRIASRVALVVGALYRMADFKDWTGTIDSASGELYYYEWRSSYYDCKPYCSGLG